MDLYIQYGIIGVIFIIALLFVVKRMIPSNKKGNCAGGCGCSMSTETKKR